MPFFRTHPLQIDQKESRNKNNKNSKKKWQTKIDTKIQVQRLTRLQKKGLRIIHTNAYRQQNGHEQSAETIQVKRRRQRRKADYSDRNSATKERGLVASWGSHMHICQCMFLFETRTGDEKDDKNSLQRFGVLHLLQREILEGSVADFTDPSNISLWRRCNTPKRWRLFLSSFSSPVRVSNKNISWNMRVRCKKSLAKLNYVMHGPY